MNSDSVKKAMAEALAEKYTSSGNYTGRLENLNQTLEQRLDQGMMDHFKAEDGYMSMAPVTPNEVAGEAMAVVQPILDKLSEVLDLLDRSKTCLTTMKELMGRADHYVGEDPGPEYHAVVWEIDRLRKVTTVEEPADWAYLSRFSATPNEIHAILAKGLCEDVHLNYQRAIGKQVAHQVCEDVREEGHVIESYSYSPSEAADRLADYVDPKNNGGPYPAKLIRLDEEKDRG